MSSYETRKKILTSLLLGALIFIYIIVISYFSVRKYLSFNAHYYDLGIMDQVIYNASRGRILQMTHPDTGINISRFAIHFDPIMIVLSPLYLIKANPIILLIVQSIVLGVGGIAVYLISLKILKSRLPALLFVFLYLNYYPLQLTNLFDFHAVTFATTGLLFAFYFFEFSPFKNKWRNIVLGLVCMLIVLFSKENASLILIFLSAYFFFTKPNKKLFALLDILNAILFIVIVFKVIPYFNHTQSFALNYYDFHHPYLSLQSFFSKETIGYGWKLLYPLGFLSVLSPLQLLISLPEFLLNILSSNPNMKLLQFHYTALITPFIIISAVYGFRTLEKIINLRFKNGIFFVTGILLMLSIYSNYQFGIGQRIPPQIDQRVFSEIQYWRGKLSNDQISVSATTSIAPFFTERLNYYNFLFDFSYQKTGQTKEAVLGTLTKYQKADYVVIYKPDIKTKEDQKIQSMIDQYYVSLIHNPKFLLISDKEGVQVFKKS